ncbi:hypothetical protein ACIP46_36075 [Streptomyces lavendulae]|uniref:hypothetical protein n=1 Tax=Streptomyces lavendulae TaxID=1914 RepID=UPI00380E67F5
MVNAGYGAERIAVTNAFEMARAYDVPIQAEVVLVDDVTISVDLRREAKGPRPLDPAEAQAALALQAAGLRETVTQLVRRPNQSWILIGSNEERLVETLGEGVAANILAVAEVADLPARPKPGWE